MLTTTIAIVALLVATVALAAAIMARIEIHNQIIERRLRGL